MGLDIAISVALAIVTSAMAYLGVRVTLHPAQSPRETRRYKIGFSTCALLGISLVIWQGIRNGRSQHDFLERISGLTAKVGSLQKDLQTTRNDLTDTKQQVVDARSEEKIESTRRQQAERDLTTTVQGVGKSTREGVISDIKQSPISVHIDGTPAPPTPIKLPNITFTWTPQQSVHDDAQFCQRLVFQSDIPVNPLALIVMFSAPLKYADPVVRDPMIGGVVVNKDDRKRLEIGIRGMAQEILRPESPVVINVCSTEDFKPLTAIRANLR